MRKLTSIIMVVCGAAMIAGIFLNWGGNISGWKMMTDTGGSIRDFSFPIFLLIGGMLSILCSGLVLLGKGSLRTLRMLEIVSLVGATLAAGPALSFAVIEETQYGIYISAAGAVIGLVVGAIAATRITKRKVETE